MSNKANSGKSPVDRKVITTTQQTISTSSSQPRNEETDSSSESSDDYMHLPVHVIDKKYKMKSQIGEGSFGSIRLGENMITKEKVAIKYEDEDSKDKEQLTREYKVYLKLGLGAPGLPKVTKRYIIWSFLE